MRDKTLPFAERLRLAAGIVGLARKAGGMRPELIGKACEHGAHGIALMRGFE